MDINENTEIWLTPKDVEKITQLSHGTVNKLFHIKGFPMVKIGRCMRVKESDFVKFMDSYRNHEISIL